MNSIDALRNALAPSFTNPTTGVVDHEGLDETVNEILYYPSVARRSLFFGLVGVSVVAVVSFALNIWQMVSTNNAIYDKIQYVQTDLNRRVDGNAATDIANKTELKDSIAATDANLSALTSKFTTLEDSLPPGGYLADVLDWYNEQDFDRDGFKGTDDWCPDIAGIKATVNPDSGSDGCPAEADSDHDTVGDFRDHCPNTTEEDTKKSVIGNIIADFGWSSDFTAYDGCVDSDDDGVADLVDACPGSDSEEVDANGCDPIQLAVKTCKATVTSAPDKGEGDVELPTGKVVYGECTLDDKQVSIECDYTEAGLTACALKG